MTDWSLLGGDPAPGDPAAIRGFASTVRGLDEILTAGSSRLAGVGLDLPAVWSGGSDAEAFSARLAAPRPIIHAFVSALQLAASAALRYASTLETLQQEATQAASSYREQFNREALQRYEGGDDPPVSGADQAGLEARAAARGAQLRAAAADAANQFAAAVNAAVPDLVRWQHSVLHGAALPPVGDLRDSPAYRSYAARVAALVRAGPPQLPSGGPAAVARYWASLDPQLRDAYLARYPDKIGNTGGIPVADRSRANVLLAKQDIAKVQRVAAKQGISADRLVKILDTTLVPAYGLTQADLDAYRCAKRCLQALRAEDGDAQRSVPLPATYLWIFQPNRYGGKGRAAITLGNPDTAANVAFCVPGLDQSVPNYIGNSDARNLYREAYRAHPSGGLAVVQWMGYSAPSASSVAFTNRARKGGHQLARDVDALRATHQGPLNLTLIGHSYGSTTVADACSYGAHPTNVILVGSPGTDRAAGAKDFGIPPNHVYVGAASRDPVTHIADDGGPLGDDPATKQFGAVRFDAETPDRDHQGVFSIGDHSLYYRPGSESLYNMADIVSGHGAHISADGMRAQGRYRLPEGRGYGEYDPEADRRPTGGHYH